MSKNQLALTEEEKARDLNAEEIKAPKDFDGKNLIELNLRNKYEMNIIGIKMGSITMMNMKVQ